MFFKNYLSEAGLPRTILPPKNTTGAAFSSDVINLKNYEHACIIISQGAWAGGSSTLTVEHCDDNTPSNDTPMAFNYRQMVDGAGATDTLGELTEATSSGITLDTANTTTIIELSADQIATASNGENSRFIIKGTSPGANNDYVSISLVLTGPRHAANVPVSAID